MIYTTSVSKQAIGRHNPADSVYPDPIEAADREAVIGVASRRAEESGWKVQRVVSYEEFSDRDLSAGRVSLEVIL